jgi:Arc/MetJ family transcription regulator
LQQVQSVFGRPLSLPGRGVIGARLMLGSVIFKAVRDSKPYPDHGLTQRDWGQLAPTQVRLDELITTKGELDLGHLLSEESTYFGDLFAHVVEWQGELYLEDGLHRALRAALQQRHVLHARILIIKG